MHPNNEIVLISNDTENVQWIIKALKRTDLSNELIWIKDTDRAFDYLVGQGLYIGKGISAYQKIFILDDAFPGAESVSGLIRSNEKLTDCPVISLSEAREVFSYASSQVFHDFISGLFGSFKSLALL